MEGKRMFEKFAEEISKPMRRDRDSNSWIRPGTWLLIDQRTSLRREDRLSQAEGRKLGRKIKAALKADRRERARRAGEKLMAHLEKGKIREAWGTIWGWHKNVEPKAAKPCSRTMEEQTKGREDLY